MAIWRYMIASHNHVERLWCDMHKCVGSNYGDLFRSLERDHLLDLLNEVDLYCLCIFTSE